MKEIEPAVIKTIAKKKVMKPEKVKIRKKKKNIYQKFLDNQHYVCYLSMLIIHTCVTLYRSIKDVCMLHKVMHLVMWSVVNKPSMIDMTSC